MGRFKNNKRAYYAVACKKKKKTLTKIHLSVLAENGNPHKNTLNKQRGERGIKERNKTKGRKKLKG